MDLDEALKKGESPLLGGITAEQLEPPAGGNGREPDAAIGNA